MEMDWVWLHLRRGISLRLSWRPGAGSHCPGGKGVLPLGRRSIKRGGKGNKFKEYQLKSKYMDI